MIEILSRKSFLYLIGIPFFFCMNHYEGIKIDGILYTLQVINNWFPERFINDPAFMFGNQDSFTIFSNVYGFLMTMFPMDVAAKLICFCGQLLFAIAMLSFIRIISVKIDRIHWALPIALAFFSIYSMGAEKSVTFFCWLVEPFPVPRTWAVAFGIFGVSALLKNRKWSSISLFVVGALFNPLLAGWGIPLWLFFYYPRTIKPICGLSILMPFSAFINVGSLASYPEDWCFRPLTYGPNIEYILRYVMYLIFFFISFHRFKEENQIQCFVKPLLFTVAISFYWYLWTGINHHIFLYQAQPWRVEWLCIISVVPLFCQMMNSFYKRYRRDGFLTTWMFALLCMGGTLFSDAHYFDGLVVGSILFFLPERKITKDVLVVLCACICFFNVFFAGGMNLITLGVQFFSFFDFSYWSTQSNRFLFFGSIMSMIWIIWAIKKKSYVQTVPFLLFVVFPKFLLFPLVGLLWDKLKKWQIVAIAMTALIDGFSCGSMRYTSVVLTYLERNQLKIVIPITLYLILMFFLVQRRLCFKWFAYLPVLWLVPLALAKYDVRTEKIKLDESGLDQFKEETIFPYIDNREKMFFFVSGSMESESRLQFLTGNYFDMQSAFGEIFYQGQYTLAMRRTSFLAYKSEKKINSMEKRGEILKDLFHQELLNRDTLADRTIFLCQNNEIEYLVTDFNNLNFSKEDSVLMERLDKFVYLYSCP